MPFVWIVHWINTICMNSAHNSPLVAPLHYTLTVYISGERLLQHMPKQEYQYLLAMRNKASGHEPEGKSVNLLRWEKLTKQKQIRKPLATCNVFKGNASKKASYDAHNDTVVNRMKQRATQASMKSLGTQEKGCYTTSASWKASRCTRRHMSQTRCRTQATHQSQT